MQRLIWTILLIPVFHAAVLLGGGQPASAQQVTWAQVTGVPADVDLYNVLMLDRTTA